MLRLLLVTIMIAAFLQGAAPEEHGQPVKETKVAEEHEAGANAMEGAAETEATDALPPGDTRTRQEVADLIQEIGPTLPDWWDSVPLEYPDTLNLHWKQVKNDWAPDYNLGAYMLTRIVERPSKWRQGVKLLHHCLEVNKDDPEALQKTRENLADKYRFLLQDHARAAYWNLQAGNSDPVLMAECCWKLGSKDLALDILSKVGSGWPNDAKAMKLWGELGEFDRAIAVAERVARSGQPDQAYLNAGDAARVTGRFDEALTYYRTGAALRRGGRYFDVNKPRLAASAKAMEAFAGTDVGTIPDGAYKGRSEGGFKGPVQVEVTVKDGRIESVVITSHSENWYGVSVAYVPAKIVEEQGIVGVDAVTGATATSRAIINATMDALAKAAR